MGADRFEGLGFALLYLFELGGDPLGDVNFEGFGAGGIRLRGCVSRAAVDCFAWLLHGAYF